MTRSPLWNVGWSAVETFDIPFAMTGGGRTSPIDYLMIAIKLGAHRALAKPFAMSDLERAISSCHEELPF